MDISADVRKRIIENSEEKYQKFFSALTPGVNNILGVRIPTLRKIAKDIYKSDWKNFLSNCSAEYVEETMLKGFVIGLIKDSPENILCYVENFVNEIDNWAVCDTFCCSLKFVNSNKALVWDFLQKYLNSKKEYEIRFGVVILLTYFIDEDYIDRVLSVLEKIRTEDYYAQMAIAWAISICYVKFETKTLAILKNNKLSQIIHNKSIQKIIESNRVSKETKSKLKLMKK